MRDYLRRARLYAWIAALGAIDRADGALWRANRRLSDALDSARSVARVRGWQCVNWQKEKERELWERHDPVPF